MRPTELVRVMTTTWRMVEPVTKRATGGRAAVSTSQNLCRGEILHELPRGGEAKGGQPGGFCPGHIVRLVIDKDAIGGGGAAAARGRGRETGGGASCLGPPTTR